jgi:hypothetical protein
VKPRNTANAQPNCGYRCGFAEAMELCAKIAQELDPDGFKCVHGHDRCEYGPDDECPYCEHDSPIAKAIRACAALAAEWGGP